MRCLNHEQLINRILQQDLSFLLKYEKSLVMGIQH